MTGFSPENFRYADIKDDGVVIYYIGDLGYTSALISRRTLDDNSEDFSLLISFALLIAPDLFRD